MTTAPARPLLDLSTLPPHLAAKFRAMNPAQLAGIFTPVTNERKQMSMQGNPHYASAVECSKRFETTAEAQADATLTLAFEQRTANLIALYSMDEACVQGMVDGADMHSENWVDVTRQIKERLGLK